MDVLGITCVLCIFLYFMFNPARKKGDRRGRSSSPEGVSKARRQDTMYKRKFIL